MDNSSSSNNGCPHRRKHTMWKSILFSLEMAAPKPCLVPRNSKIVTSSSNKDERLTSSSQTLSPPQGISTAPESEVQQTTDSGIKDKLSPQKVIHQSLKQSQQSFYTKFYSSIDDNDVLDHSANFEVPPGFGLDYHGPLSKADCEKLLLKDGDYLVRRSFTKKNAEHLILSLRFDGKLKHYQLFFNNLQEVYSLGPDKEQFSTLHELVAKGFVTLYMESRAGSFLFPQQEPSAVSENLSSGENSSEKSRSEFQPKIQESYEDFCNSETEQDLTKEISEKLQNHGLELAEEKLTSEYYTQTSVESTNSDSCKTFSNENESKSIEEGCANQVPYSATPYYEVTRSLRKYNARKYSKTTNQDVTDYHEESSEPNVAHLHPEKPFSNETDMTQQISSKDKLKVDLEDDRGTKDQVNKRSSRFWKFGTRKEISNKAVDNPDDISGIPHKFKVQTFNFTWCSICTHFLFGLRRQGVRCVKCKLAAHTTCAATIPSDCTPQLAELSGLFGKDLSTLMTPEVNSTLEHPLYSTPSSPTGAILPPIDHDMVPLVVKLCIEEVESRGLESEGIYRVSGGVDHIQAIRITLEKGGGKESVSESNVGDINAVAGVLKLFFRQLPVPLITERCFTILLQAYENSNDQLLTLRTALRVLPPAHYHTLLLLLQHFSRIVAKCSENKMTATSLSVVFAPTLVEHSTSAPFTSTVDASKKFSAKVAKEEKKCPLASAEELNELGSDEDDACGWDNTTNNHTSKSSSSSNLAAPSSSYSNAKHGIASSSDNLNTAGLANATTSIMGAVSGTNSNQSLTHVADLVPDKTADSRGQFNGVISNPCFLSTNSSDLTADHLLCMKYAALEPKVLELLILSYPKLFPL